MTDLLTPMVELSKSLGLFVGSVADDTFRVYTRMGGKALSPRGDALQTTAWMIDYKLKNDL